MAMIIATGYIVSEAPPIKRALISLCKIPKNGVQGVVFIAIASAILGWISWGLGLVAGAILARSVALNLRKVDFKLYVAVAYTGAITTGLFGISGSEFLLVNTPGYFMENMLGLIPLSETVFEPSLLLAQASIVLKLFLEPKPVVCAQQSVSLALLMILTQVLVNQW